jgi:hypothetical protein
VLVTAAPQGNGRLAVLIRAQTLPATPSNTLRSIRVVSLGNAKLLLGGAELQPGQVATFQDGAGAAELTLQRPTPGQASTAQLVVTDDCGEWPTLVGGGPNAF